jgi:hypothetical protein
LSPVEVDRIGFRDDIVQAWPLHRAMHYLDQVKFNLAFENTHHYPMFMGYGIRDIRDQSTAGLAEFPTEKHLMGNFFDEMLCAINNAVDHHAPVKTCSRHSSTTYGRNP